MKNSIKFTIAGMIMSFVSISAIAQGNLTLEVNINDLHSSEGKIMMELRDEDENTVYDVAGDIENGSCKVIFKSLIAGTYAVRFFHDEDSSGEMETGAFGRPEEGYGFSNDARGMMGPPSFKNQLFELKNDTVMTLATEY